MGHHTAEGLKRVGLKSSFAPSMKQITNGCPALWGFKQYLHYEGNITDTDAKENAVD